MRVFAGSYCVLYNHLANFITSLLNMVRFLYWQLFILGQSCINTYLTWRPLSRVLHTSAMQCLFQQNISCPIHFWNIMLRFVFGPISQWWRIALKKKKFNCIRIWIWIFTKIESVWPCYTPNLSTKFHLNLSIIFWDILHTKNKQTDGQTGVKT